MTASSKEKFIKRIDQLLEEAEKVKATEKRPARGGDGIAIILLPRLDNNAFSAWKHSTQNLIARTVGEDSFYYKSFLEQVTENFKSHVDVGMGILSFLKKELESGFLDPEPIKDLISEMDSNDKTKTPSVAKVGGSKVFVVHGHNEEALLKIEKFLQKLQLDSVILKEEPSKGLTIIEKFLEFSDQAGFAIILLTPDDRGGRESDPYEKQLPRARQNVILEFGFFLGRLGREHICVLRQQNVEIPSDYNGVVFIPFDESGAWQIDLAKEMRKAGLDINLNQL